MLFFGKNKQVTYNKETIGFYFEEIRKYKITFWIGLITIPVAAVIFDTVVPYYISQAIEILGQMDYKKFEAVILLTGGISLVGVILNLLGYQSLVFHESSVKSGLSLNVMRRLLNKDQGFFSNQKTGALTGKYIDFVNGHSSLQQLLIGKVIAFVINTTLGLIIVYGQAPMLAYVVIFLIVGLVLQVRISKRLKVGMTSQRKKLVADINGTAADIITNSSSVKIFATEKHELKNMQELNDKLKKVYRREYKWHSIEGSGRIFFMQIMQVFSILAVGKLFIDGAITISMAIFVIIYLQKISSQLFDLGEILFGYDKIMLQVSPMTEIMLEPELVVDKTDKKLKVKNGRIEFRSITYKYPDNERYDVFRGLSLDIKPGQKVGLVGYSGSGKTTLTRLLLRLDDVNSGAIVIDGQDISMVSQSSLRTAISYVPQEPMLFHRTLRENIAYGCKANDKQIMEAAKKANAYDFISNLEYGLDTIVGERGVKLSGGQRQRIVIARAILKNSPILILDEATSALDSESEKLIQKSLNNLMKNRTSIVIAHRLSTIAKLDRIVVLDSGAIVEDGTHSELLALNGHYSKLWSHQSGGFIEESV